MKYTRELVIGLMFILALALFIWGYNFLKGINVFSGERIYYGVYDKVDGLIKSNPISINGLKIGQVKDLYFEENFSGNIIVIMSVKTNFPIPRNSIARIYSSDLMGSKSIEINLGDSRELARSGDTLYTDIEAGIKEEVNRQVQPLKRKAENLITSIDTMVTAIQTVFNESARENLILSFENIQATFENLAHATSQVDTFLYLEGKKMATIVSNLQEITNELNNNKGNITNALENISAISDSLKNANIPQAFTNANKSLQELNAILEKINRGEGSAGQLIHNDSLYTQLTKASKDLNLLLEDIRNNPKKYVRFSIF